MIGLNPIDGEHHSIGSMLVPSCDGSRASKQSINSGYLCAPES